MESKICTQCKIEKHINNFYKKYSESRDCNIKRGVKRYYDKKDSISMQQKLYYEKIEKNFYRNKMIIAKKEAQIIKNYKDPMLNYKIN